VEGSPDSRNNYFPQYLNLLPIMKATLVTLTMLLSVVHRGDSHATFGHNSGG
jgi:hypothetical protein